MAVAGQWGRFTPARKLDLISQVYQPGDSSALTIATRLHEKFGIVVTRNAIIGTYGRQPELREKYPFTGTKPSPNARKSFAGEFAKARREEIARAKMTKAEERELRDKIEHESTVERAFRKSHEAKRAERREWEDANCKKVTLLQLESHQCKWPINNGGPFLFCAVGVYDTHQYCDFHRKCM